MSVNSDNIPAYNKLSEIIRKEVGRVTESYFKHNSGMPVDDDIKLLSSDNTNPILSRDHFISENKEQDIEEKGKESIKDRTDSRVNFKEQKEQLNLENITAFASDELENDPIVTSDPVDEDWITRFFTMAKDVSSEEMQALWGRILAGEIKQPKSYSLRALELIKSLSKEEAEIFMKVANFVFECNRTFMLFKGKNEDLLAKNDISFGMITLLIELGIIQPGDFIEFQLKKAANQIKTGFVFGKTIVIAERSENTPDLSVPIYLFTKVGTQLLKLTEIAPPFDYLKAFGKYLNQNQFDASFSEITSRTPNAINYKQPILKFPD